ncbi:hypothetical protein E2C01_023074 [Portunus trituberculatus]|uniref:Uncharacterized protein n=1 Tax=Portunus trituberculatus TaxID=210409 RepID=A0A5B7E734_PORTR|nr:hypothetical protein [Portunus trituberculatus]
MCHMKQAEMDSLSLPKNLNQVVTGGGAGHTHPAPPAGTVWPAAGGCIFSKRKTNAEFKRPLYCVLNTSLAFVFWLGFPSQHANNAFVDEALQGLMPMVFLFSINLSASLHGIVLLPPVTRIKMKSDYNVVTLRDASTQLRGDSSSWSSSSSESSRGLSFLVPSSAALPLFLLGSIKPYLKQISLWFIANSKNTCLTCCSQLDVLPGCCLTLHPDVKACVVLPGVSPNHQARPETASHQRQQPYHQQHNVDIRQLIAQEFASEMERPVPAATAATMPKQIMEIKDFLLTARRKDAKCEYYCNCSGGYWAFLRLVLVLVVFSVNIYKSFLPIIPNPLPKNSKLGHHDG